MRQRSQRSDQRIRRFLALSYSAESEDNMISLHVDGLEEEAWFLLHTGTREAEDIQGGSFSVVEDGVYLICAEEDEVKIRLSEEERKAIVLLRGLKMKVCIVAEGCYPYVVGGVSSWINSMIKAFPDIEFVVLAIVANRSYRKICL